MHVPVAEQDLLAGFCDNDNEPPSFIRLKNFIASAAIGKRSYLTEFSIILIPLYGSINTGTGDTWCHFQNRETHQSEKVLCRCSMC